MKGDIFIKDLAKVLNNHNMDTAADIPDHILAKYLESCLEAYLLVNYRNQKWHGENNQGNCKTTK